MNLKQANDRYDAILCDDCKQLEPQELPILIFRGQFWCVHKIDKKQMKKKIK